MPVKCGDGIAAIDLNGQCRASPNPTMGALEAVDRSSVAPLPRSSDLSRLSFLYGGSFYESLF